MRANRLRLPAVLALLSLAAAGRHTPQQPLPLPPTPPPGGPPGLVAPTPNMFLAVPATTSDSDGPTVAPAWMGSRPVTQSQGFIPGSQVQSRPDGHVEIAPGISLKLPLH